MTVALIGGFLMIFLRFKNDRVRNIYSEVIALVTTVLVWIALIKADGSAVTLYRFTYGFTISFGVDGLSKLFAGMVSLMWPFALLYAFEYMKDDKRKNVFFAFYLMTYGITLGVCFSSNITTLYVFYEMLSLVTIPLVSHYGDHESMYAGRKYAAYTIGGASLAFFAVVIATVYGGGGNFIYGGSLGAARAASGNTMSMGMLQIAFLFGFFGFGAKAAVFPLHDWLPTASVAPTPVTALLHAVAVVNTGAFAVMRLTWYLHGADLIRGSWVQAVCLIAAEFSLVYGAVQALRERRFKRRLAFSTMSNLSYMLFGIMLLTPAGYLGGLSHMLFHGVIKMSLFLCAGAFMRQTGKNYVFEINGVGRKMPVTFICYTLGALSLTGIPLFCGFISKWTLISAGADEGSALGIIGVVALIVSAFFCAMYTLTVSVRAFFPMKGKDFYADGTEGCAVKEAGWKMLVPVVVFTIANVLFGVFSGPIMSFLTKIAEGVI